MAVTIKNVEVSKEVIISSLRIGETFLSNGTLYQHKGREYRRLSPLHAESFYVATNLKTGVSVKFTDLTPVEPVDIEITVLRK